MNQTKISAMLQLALRYENLLSQETKLTFMNPLTYKWEIIVSYVGDIEKIRQLINGTVEILLDNFIVLEIDKNDIEPVSELDEVIYMTLPERMFYTNINLGEVCAQNLGNPSGNYQEKGENSVVIVVDSGINYLHPAFINEDGTTRIMSIWDQTLEGTPPLGFYNGAEYSEEQINEALKTSTQEEALSMVPSMDEIGHGTALAGIAAGNGRGIVPENPGVAPKSRLIIVKVGQRGTQGKYPRTVDIMRGLAYGLRKIGEKVPRVFLVGCGYNLNGHNGETFLEAYMNSIGLTWGCNIVVGVGNQGDKGTHVEGNISQDEEKTIQLYIDNQQPSYACCLFKNFIDEINIVITSPQGERTEELSSFTPTRAFLFEHTAVLIHLTQAITAFEFQEIFIWFQGQEGESVNTGIWQIKISGKEIVEGRYNIWAEEDPRNRVGNRFLTATLETTQSSPAMADAVTSVAAVSVTTQVANFSGKGFTVSGKVKPDLAAPGVNILAPSIGEMLYSPITGTSAAAAFVAGAYAIMLSYLNRLDVRTISGKELKIFLLRNATRNEIYAPYPNRSYGYGRLCIEEAMRNLIEVINKTN